MEKELGFWNFIKGVGLDLAAGGIILVLVFFMTLVMGTLFVLIAIFGESMALLGTIVTISLLPVFIIGGLFLNIHLTRIIRRSRNPLLKRFRERTLPYSEYSSGYRTRYILQRIVSLTIMVGLFLICTIFVALTLSIPLLCCLLFPVVYPALLASIALPAVAWVVFTYAFDPYEPEPRSFLILGLFWGMLSTFPSLFLNTYNDTWMPSVGLSTAVVSAPVFEELFKAIGFVLIFSQIKDETDGIIYGATFGAGFALLENVLYSANGILLSDGNPAITYTILILFRSFFNMVVHMIGPVLIGFLIGSIRARQCRDIDSCGSKLPMTAFLLLVIPIGYLFAVLNHALWNYIAGFNSLLSIAILMLIGGAEACLFVAFVLLGYVQATNRYLKNNPMSNPGGI
ncbi:MAG: PrsW family intramembrane metalloprotease [Thermoplasmatota archaeon]